MPEEKDRTYESASPQKVEWGKRADGTTVYLIQSAEIPGLYITEGALRTRPVPDWLRDAPPEPKVKKGFISTLLSFL